MRADAIKVLAVLLVLAAANGQAFAQQAADKAPAKPATPAAWELSSCQHNNMGCRSEGRYPTSGACEAARRVFVRENPNRSAGCMKLPY